MRTLNALLRQHSLQLKDMAPWIWLYEVEVPVTPLPKRLRLTNYTRQVQFGTTTLGDPVTYYPFPLTHDVIEASGDGDLPTIQVNVGNYTREISDVLAQYNGLIGQPAIIRLVNSATLTVSGAEIREDSTIKAARVTSGVVSFTLSPFNLYERQFPPFRCVRLACRHQYGGAACGYDLTRPGALTTCAKTWEDCIDHGIDEEGAGLTSAHPLRFGGFPGIPRA